MKCPMMNIFEKCCCSYGMVCPFCCRLTVVAMVMIFGALLAWKPRKTIDIQIALYRLVNWKIEPIDMKKEIRNTSIMGLALVALGVISLVYILLK